MMLHRSESDTVREGAMAKERSAASASFSIDQALDQARESQQKLEHATAAAA
jgi:hypothetical protein